jgi:hypothetical protein
MIGNIVSVHFRDISRIQSKDKEGQIEFIIPDKIMGQAVNHLYFHKVPNNNQHNLTKLISCPN